MRNLDAIVAALNDMESPRDGIIALLTSIHNELVEARQNNDGEAIDAIIARINDSKDRMAQAVVANTIAEEPPAGNGGAATGAADAGTATSGEGSGSGVGEGILDEMQGDAEQPDPVAETEQSGDTQSGDEQAQAQQEE